MADASWGIEKDVAAGKAEQGGQGDKARASAPQALTFTRQMALLYNPRSYSGTLRVVEMDYTDIGEVYQISLTEQEATVVEGRAATATTVIKTPFELWQRIARGEIEGSQALGQGLYTVEGDFSLMLHWDSVFGTGDGVLRLRQLRHVAGGLASFCEASHDAGLAATPDGVLGLRSH